MANGTAPSNGTTPSNGNQSTPPSAPPEPPPDADPHARGLRAWQVVIAAALTCLGSIAGAWLTGAAGGDEAAPVARTAEGISAPGTTALEIYSLTVPKRSSANTYRIEGKVADLSPCEQVRIIVQLPNAGPHSPSHGERGPRWLVSPAAQVMKGGRWEVVWKPDAESVSGKWMAIVVKVPRGLCEASDARPKQLAALEE